MIEKAEFISCADNDTRYVKAGEHLGFSGLAHETRYNWVIKNWDLSDKYILDFGCGSGYGVAMLSEKARLIDGIDRSEASMAFAKETYTRDNIRFFALDACDKHAVLSHLKKDTYDVIVSFDVFEHLEKYFDYLDNISLLLKNDGILFIGCPNRLQTFQWNESWNQYHFQEFSPYQLRRILSMYFESVTMMGQDFRDAGKREIARRGNYMREHRSLGQVLKGFIPGPIKKPLKTILKKSKIMTQNIFQYDDIEFKSEPGEAVLEKAFGLVAICKNKKH